MGPGLQDLPIPPADLVPLPLPVGVLKLLLLASFAVHILAVDIGVGGAIVCLVLALRGRTSEAHRGLARAVAWVLPPAVTFAITLGVAPLLFVQLLYGRFLYTSSILMAVPWLSFIFALMAGYALLYRHTGLVRSDRFSLPAALASTLLLLWLGFLWTNNATLMLEPQRWGDLAAGAPHGGALNLGDATVIPRFLHMAMAMTAVAALFVGTASAFVADGAFDRDLARRFGMRTFASVTAAQLLIGPAVLLLQRSDVRSGLLGGSIRAVVALCVGVTCAMAAIATALRGANPSTGRRGVLVPFFLIHGTIFAMVVIRDEVRDLSLGAAGFHVESTPVGIDALAAGLFGAAVIVLGWVLRLFWRWIRAGKPGRVPVPPAVSEATDGG